MTLPNNNALTISLNTLYTNNMHNMRGSDIDNIIMSVFGTNDVPQTRLCPECHHDDFVEDYSKGILICKCGQVIDNLYDAIYERHQHDGDEGDMTRSNIAYNKLLPQSSLGTSLKGKGKIRKLQMWNSMQYRERSLMTIFKQIHTICTKHNIIKRIEDDTKIINSRISTKVHQTGKNKGKPIITRGDNRKGIIGATHLISCTRNGEPRSTKEIASYWGIDEKDINKGLKSLRCILVDDDIIKDTGTSKVTDFIRRKCDELQIKNKYTEIAIIIANNTDKLNLASNHTTYSLSAACILLMAEMNNIQCINRKRLSSIFNVSDVTIGKTFTQIEKYRNILVDNQQVNAILKRVDKFKQKKFINRAIWTQMKRFGVDTSKYMLDDSDIKDMKTYVDAATTKLDASLKTLNNTEEIYKQYLSYMTDIDAAYNYADDVFKATYTNTEAALDKLLK